MADIGPLLIPALAAVGGAGITALGAYMANRERYSQRIERLAAIRDKVADNPHLLQRIDQLIHFEVSATASSKSRTTLVYCATVLLVLSYTVYVSQMVLEPSRLRSFLESPSTDWLVLISSAAGLIMFASIGSSRKRDLRKSLPEILPISRLDFETPSSGDRSSD